LLHPASLIIPLLVLLPNLFFFAGKPADKTGEAKRREPPLLVALEGIGRSGVFLLPGFFAIHTGRLYEFAALIGMLVSLALYYYGWVRYFRHGRENSLLFSPILGIPIPMAVSPILYFLLAAVVLRAPPLFLSALILVAGHIPISLQQYRRN